MSTVTNPPNTRTKRKSTSSPKATGAIDVKKSRQSKTSNPDSEKAEVPLATTRITSTQNSETSTDPTGVESVDLFSSPLSSPHHNLTVPTPRGPIDFTLESNVGATVRTSQYDATDPEIEFSSEYPVVLRDAALSNDMASFVRILDSRMNRLASKEDMLGVVTKVDENAAVIRKLNSAMELIRNDLDNVDRIRRVVEKVWTERAKDLNLSTPRPNFATGASCSEQDEARNKKYLISRRTLRVLPIGGESTQEMEECLFQFLNGGLLMSKNEISALGIERVERTQSSNKSRTYKEVRVIMSDADASHLRTIRIVCSGPSSNSPLPPNDS